MSIFRLPVPISFFNGRTAIPTSKSEITREIQSGKFIGNACRERSCHDTGSLLIPHPLNHDYSESSSMAAPKHFMNGTVPR